MLTNIAKAIYESRNGPGAKPWAHLPASYKAPYMMDAEAAERVVRETLASASAMRASLTVDEGASAAIADAVREWRTVHDVFDGV